MIERYTLPEMAEVWSEEAAFEAWLAVELAVADAMAERGIIPKDAAERLRRKAKIDVEAIHEVEKRTRHDLLAFLEVVGRSVGDDMRHLHLGLTSSDVKDTALALQLRKAGALIRVEMEGLSAVLRKRALEHRTTLMVGRTHGIHAEPLTFGLKVAVWYEEIRRQGRRLEAAIQEVAVGKISGAVGTYAEVEPAIEVEACERLALGVEPISTQIIQRDRHAFFVGVLAGIAGSLEKIAVEIRNLQRTDILEVEEAFRGGQKGSSAMPHKKNPITSEQITGLTRILRGYAGAALENVALWHERDLSHSSAERILLPDSTTLLHFLLRRMTGVLEGLVIHPERMMQNLQATQGLVFSQRVLLALVERGWSREEAYRVVQGHAMVTWQTQEPFQARLQNDPILQTALPSEVLAAIFRYENFLPHIDTIYRRLGLLPA